MVFLHYMVTSKCLKRFLKKKLFFKKDFRKFFADSIFMILSQIWTIFVENLVIWYFLVNCWLPWSVAVRFGYLTDQEKSVLVRFCG